MWFLVWFLLKGVEGNGIVSNLKSVVASIRIDELLCSKLDVKMFLSLEQ